MTQRFRILFCRALRRFVGTLLIAFAALPAEADNPSSGHGKSAIVVDGNSGNVLYSAKSDELGHTTSLTKIMTLYLLFERMEAGKFKLNSQLSVSRHASVQAPSKLELRPGQTITVEDAIRSMVTKSANDVAVVVAEAIGGSEGEFANMMTKKAHALGMSRTVYRNASGLPNEGQLTTARDQALLGRAIQERFPRQYRYFSTPSLTYNGETMSNHNHLLGQIEGIDGIKTGLHSSIWIQSCDVGTSQQTLHRRGGTGRRNRRSTRYTYARSDRGAHRHREYAAYRPGDHRNRGGKEPKAGR